MGYLRSDFQVFQIETNKEVKQAEEESSAIKMITKVKIVQQNEAKSEISGCPFKKQVQLTLLPEACEDVSMKSCCSSYMLSCVSKCSDFKKPEFAPT